MFLINWFAENPTLSNTVTIVGLVVGAWLIGAWLAGALRMKDYGWKFGCILFAIFASIAIIWRGWPPHLGIDLGGGSILVYKVDHSATDWRPEKMDSLVSAISERVNPGGQKEISVRGLGTDMVQITMPSVSGATAKDKEAQMQEVKDIIHRTGALEFRILATRRFNQSLIERAAAARKEACERDPNTNDARIVYGDRIDPYTGKPREVAKWCPVRDNKKEQDALRGDDAAIEVNDGKDADGKEKKRLEILVLAPENESTDVTGKYIRNAEPVQGERGWQVDFAFNTEGGAKFGKLTGEHVPLDNGAFKFKLAIVLDNVLQSAPNLQSAISDRGEITGDFTQKEVTELCDIINRGSLPAALNPTPEREMTTEATLGADTIHQSLVAMIIAAIVVPVFMIYYYRFAGVVAVAVLSLTVLMLVAIMVLVKAPFTLTALAGLALSVGMEVDNNVLIYERLREELHHGAALRMGLRNSFHRVGVVIVDANITHILAAAVLFYVGTEQVKGFAITFLLGALLSIWATMFVAKTIFEVAERRFRIQKMHMMQWIGHTTIDFMHWFRVCLTFSILITVLGLVVAFVRGKGLFDIDFTGGISVQTLFRDATKVEDIRNVIAKHEKELPDATVTPVHNSNEPDDRRFVIDTSNPDGTAVRDLIQELFAGKLVTAEMKPEPAQTVTNASPGTTVPEPSEKPAPAAPSETPSSPGPKPKDEPRDMSTSPAPVMKAAEPKTAEPKAAEPKAPEAKTTATPPAGAAAPKSSAAPPAPGKQSRLEVPRADDLATIEPDSFVYTALDDSAGTGDAKAEETQVEKKENAEAAPTAGNLEFRIVATKRFNQSLIELAAAARKAACKDDCKTEKARVIYGDMPDPHTGKRREVAKWCVIRDTKERRDYWRDDDAAIEVYDGKDQAGKDKHRLELLVLAPETQATSVTGNDIREVHAAMGAVGWEVDFALTSKGGAKFRKLTREHVPLDDGVFKFRLAIVLDDVVQSAPTLQSEIGDRGTITGDFTEREARNIVDIINRRRKAKQPEATPAAEKPAQPKRSQLDVQRPGFDVITEPETVVYTALDVSSGTGATTEIKTQATGGTAAAAPQGTGAKSEVKAESKALARPEAKPENGAEGKVEVKAEREATGASAATGVENKAAPTTPAASDSAAFQSPEVAQPPTQAKLHFTVALTTMEGTTAVEKTQEAKFAKDQLHDLIEQALVDNKLPKTVPFELANTSNAAAADEWTVTFTPPPGAKYKLTAEKVQTVLKTVEAEVAKQAFFPGVDNMGSAVATDTRFWACVALVLSWSLIILYLWIRFQGVAFGVAAVIALIHDVLVMLGAIAFSSYLARIPGATAVTLIEPFKINLTIVAAFLTIIGYSVNDTIVVFDRIREIRGKSPTLTREMVNDATNQTLSRTVLTSFTVLLVVAILYIFGGQAVHGFAFALFIGVLTGTYSSIYVAAPILLWLLHPKEMKASTASGSSMSSTR